MHVCATGRACKRTRVNGCRSVHACAHSTCARAGREGDSAGEGEGGRLTDADQKSFGLKQQRRHEY